MNRLYIVICMMLFFASCKNDKSGEQENPNNYVEVTKVKFKQGKMQLGTLEKKTIQELIHFSGKIIPTIDGLAKISAPVEGVVEKVMVYSEQEVKANTSLLTIGGNALIELQQEYAASSAKIKQLQANYERVKKLFDANIKTENEFMLAQSEYLSELAKNKALKLRLKQINIDPSKVKEGDYSLTYTIKSPISGQINLLNVLPGQYLKPEVEIAEIVDKNKSEIQLTFYESDFSKIKLGQTVFFSSLNNSELSSEAKITRIGSMLNGTSNILECYAKISKDSFDGFVINQMIHGEVVVALDSVWAVPRCAIINEGDYNYVLATAEETKNGYKLEKRKVEIGKSDRENIEILNLDKNTLILLTDAEGVFD